MKSIPASFSAAACFATLLAAVLIAAPCIGADLLVTHARDGGAGSLRQAMLDANRNPGADRIRFDSVNGPFAEPRTLVLSGSLPSITDDLEIDGYIPDRLWMPSGVTIDGAGKGRVFHVGPGVRVQLRYLGVTGGRASQGGGLLSEGDTVIDSSIFHANHADEGGGVAQQSGSLRLINTTVWNNVATKRGGGLSLGGHRAVLTHCTLSANQAPLGAGLHNSAHLEVANSILANSLIGEDCYSTVPLQLTSKRNLVERGEGCGTAFLSADPRLGEPGMYNGPTLSMPLEGGSPAINWADNAMSVDASGQLLVWDQRGNGDPRFAAGIADLGAFEEQAITVLEVDVREDLDVRGCSSAPKDCSLRGAIALANASPQHGDITFSPKVFRNDPWVELRHPLPPIAQDLSMAATIDAGIRLVGPPGWLSPSPGVRLELNRVRLQPE